MLAKPVKFSTRGDDVKVPPMGLLNRAAEKFGDDGTAPDAFWWKDFFNLTGEHMICTQEDGWVDGSAKGEYLPDDILDEVNAQPTPAPSQDAEKTPELVEIREGGAWPTCTWCGKPIEIETPVRVGVISGRILDQRHTACVGAEQREKTPEKGVQS